VEEWAAAAEVDVETAATAADMVVTGA